MALIVYEGPSSLPLNVSEDKSTVLGKKFVGLANQGATCYLNGLLQTLFMTPPFRRAIFTWNYDASKDGAEDFCIPLQLQKLFGLLQLSKTRAVDTVGLTKSFGWEGSEVFQQQDVQELTRVLFDALEEAFRGTEMETIIDDLYAGQLIDYLRCIDVDYQSERVDKFLDFSLAIAPFGQTKTMKNLTECIEMFLQPEILNGDNKYFCEKFNQKVDAIKGLKFGRLPQIMSIQLKRFVYDFSGDYVVQKKLNDQVKVPMILDMNKYVAKKRGESVDGGEPIEIVNEEFEEFLQQQMSKLTRRDSSAEAPIASVTDNEEPQLSDIDLDQDGTKDPDCPPLLVDEDAPIVTSYVSAPGAAEAAAATAKVVDSVEQDATDTVFYGSMSDEEVSEMIEKHGEWIYELYAVLIHSGAITGGHYYAYIKDLASKKWYNFNDSSVTPINEKTVEDAWGGKPATYNGVSSSSSNTYSSSNGYMFMYRKVGNLESDEVPDDVIPQYIHEMVKLEEEKRLIKQKEEEELRNKLSVRIYWKGKDYFVPMKRTFTVREALEKAWERFDLGTYLAEKEVSGEDLTPSIPEVTNTNIYNIADIDDYPLSIPPSPPAEIDNTTVKPPTPPTEVPKINPIPMNVDLIRFREYNHYTKLVTGAFDTKNHGDKALSELYFNDYKSYIIETRKPSEEWEEYFADGISVLVEEFDAVQMVFKDPRTVRLPKGSTVADLKEKIKDFIAFDIANVRISKIIALAYNDGRQDFLTKAELRLREDYQVFEGSKICVEDGLSCPGPNDSLAFATFLNLKNKIEIHYNIPPSSTFDFTMIVDGRWKLKDFRETMAKTVGIAPGECRMFKGNARGNEFKDSDITLVSAGVHNQMNLFITLGNPTPAFHFPVLLFKFTALEYVPGVIELSIPEVTEPSETEEIPSGAVTDPWNTMNDDGVITPLPTSPRNPHAAAVGINPYQKKVPAEYEMHALSSIQENEAAYDPLDQIIDEADDLLMRRGYDDGGEDLDDLSNKGVEGDADQDSLDDGYVPALEQANGDFYTDEDDDALLQEALILTASYPQNVSEDGVRVSLSDGTKADVSEASPVTAQPVLTVERSISRDRSSSKDAVQNVVHMVETSTTEKGASQVETSVEAIDAEYFDTASEKLSEKNLQQNSHALNFGSRLNPLDLTGLDGDASYFSSNPTNPFKSDTIDYTNNYTSGPKNKVSIDPIVSHIDDDDEDLAAAIAAVDAAVAEAELKAAAAAAAEESKKAEENKEADNVSVLEPSDFGQRMVKNSIFPSQFEEITAINNMYVGMNTRISDFRVMVHSELIRVGVIDDSVSLHRIRIREKIGNSPGKFLRDGKTIADSQIYLSDHKTFCIEILEAEEFLPEDDHGDVVVQVQKWQRRTWSLSTKQDVLFSGSRTVQEVSRGLAALHDIPLHSLRVLVVPRDTSFLIYELTQRQPSRNYGRAWFDPTQEKKLLRYMSHDMRLIEGDLLLLQDINEPLMELTAADVLSIRLVEETQNTPTYNYQWPVHRSNATSSTSTSIPAWAQDTTNNYSMNYKYPTAVIVSNGNSSSSSKGIRIKTQKDRQREASEIAEKAVDKAGFQEQLSTVLRRRSSSGHAVDTSAGRASPIEIGGVDQGVSIATGTDDLLTGDDYPIARGRYDDLDDFIKNGGPTIFSDIM